MRDRLTTLGELVGFGVGVVGFGMLSPALGLIAAGAGLVLVSFLAGGDR